MTLYFFVSTIILHSDFILRCSLMKQVAKYFDLYNLFFYYIPSIKLCMCASLEVCSQKPIQETSDRLVSVLHAKNETNIK